MRKGFIGLTVVFLFVWMGLFPRIRGMAADADIFIFPLGYNDGQTYAPRITHDNQGNLIENTDFDAQNPDLSEPSSCFGPPMQQLHHAGEDLYRNGQDPIEGAEVVAVADGTVIEYKHRFNYPGKAVVIEHTLSNGTYVYSVYMHLRDVQVQEGEHVLRGQTIGYVIYQPYDGNYPGYHSPDDSHLHFEIRYFADASQVYRDHGYMQCAIWGDKAGRGYTPPDVHADGWGYTDPTDFILAHQPPTPTPSFTPTSTPTFTPMPTPTPTASPPAEWICPLPEEPTLCYRIYSGDLPVSDGMQVDCPNCGWAAQCTDFVLEDWRIAGSRWSSDNWAGWIIGSDSPHWAEITFQVFDENPGQGWDVCSGWVEVGPQRGTLPWRVNPVEGCGSHTEIVRPDRYPATYSTGHLPLVYRLCAWRDSGIRLGAVRVHEWRFVTMPTPTPSPTPSPTPTSCLLQRMQPEMPGLQDLRLFYRVRGKLSQTPAGERYVAMYYRYSPTLIRLVQEDAEVRQAFGEALRVWRPVLQAWVEGEDVLLSREQVATLHRFLNLLAQRGGPSLQAAVAQEMRRVPWTRLTGMRANEVEALLLGAGRAPQGVPIPTGTPQP